MARKKQSDSEIVNSYISPIIRVKAQLDLWEILTGGYAKKIAKTTNQHRSTGIGLRGVAVEWARIGWGLKWSETRVEIGYKHLYEMQDLGLLQIVDDPNLPNANSDLFRRILINEEKIATANTLIKSQM